MAVQTIVVAADGSKASNKAVRWAALVAKQNGAHVVAVYAVEPDKMPIPYLSLDDAVQRARISAWRSQVGKQILSDWCAPLHDAHVNFSTEIHDGFAPSVILAAAQKHRADLLVMGSRGHGGFVGLLLGSVSDYLMHHSPCPVVIIRPETEVRHRPHRVLVGVDESPDSLLACKWAEDFVMAMKGRLLAATVLPEPAIWDSTLELEVERDIERRMNERHAEVEARGCPCEVEILAGSPAKELMRFGQEKNVDLIVVGQMGLTGMRAATLGSVGRQLAHHSAFPLVIVRYAALAGELQVRARKAETTPVTGSPASR